MTEIIPLLTRLVEALERAHPPAPPLPDFAKMEGFMWNNGQLHAVKKISRVDLSLLKSIDSVRDILVENTLRFARRASANNALLWGARGMGKSSLVKACVGEANRLGIPLKLVEIHREDIESLPELMNILRAQPYQFILFCDDLSFDSGETSYKSLKAILDGGIEGRPENALLYATSNRRHILAREMIENERQAAIHSSEAIEEKVSLSDRFGLWLGFHRANQDEFLEMVDGYAKHFKLKTDKEHLHFEALQWATMRGSRSGRVAWQFIQDYMGRK